MDDFWDKLLMSGIVLAIALVLRFVLLFAIRRTVRALPVRSAPVASDAEPGSRTRKMLDKAAGLSSARQKQRLTTLPQHLLTGACFIEKRFQFCGDVFVQRFKEY